MSDVYIYFLGYSSAGHVIVLKQSDSLFFIVLFSFSGALPLLNSYYGKPDCAIHYSYILCNGNEQLITSCNKIIHSLEEGRQIYNEADVAGVACNPASPNNFTSSIMPPKSV